MKKLLSILLLVCLLIPAAVAEDIDLSKLSFDELASLRDRCQMEMLSRSEWKEVQVPQGIWQVGKDIPAGDWIIKCADVGRTNVSMRICVFLWGEGYPKDESFEYKKRVGRIKVANPENKYYNEYESGTPTEARVHLEDGQYIVIENGFNAAVFMRDFATAPFSFK